MKLKELRKYIESLPESLDDYLVVNGEMGYLDENKTVILVNKPIITIYADKKSNEIQLFHQTEEDVKEIIRNGNTKTN
jgi:hypothetical protein